MFGTFKAWRGQVLGSLHKAFSAKPSSSVTSFAELQKLAIEQQQTNNITDSFQTLLTLDRQLRTSILQNQNVSYLANRAPTSTISQIVYEKACLLANNLDILSESFYKETCQEDYMKAGFKLRMYARDVATGATMRWSAQNYKETANLLNKTIQKLIELIKAHRAKHPNVYDRYTRKSVQNHEAYNDNSDTSPISHLNQLGMIKKTVNAIGQLINALKLHKNPELNKSLRLELPSISQLNAALYQIGLGKPTLTT